jgi:hypothetical protein
LETLTTSERERERKRELLDKVYVWSLVDGKSLGQKEKKEEEKNNNKKL